LQLTVKDDSITASGPRHALSLEPCGGPSLETVMENQRGLTIHFADGRKMTLAFPQQTANPIAAQLKLDDVLKLRQILIEVEGALIVVPFENINYFQLHPAPAKVLGHTYVTGATVVE
jgi:hypothetical protein